MQKIRYICKNCGAEHLIIAQWGDLRPKRCRNKKCNTSFLAHPDKLIIKLPQTPEPEKEVEEVKVVKKQSKKVSKKDKVEELDE